MPECLRDHELLRAGRRPPAVTLFPGFSSLFVDFQKKNLRRKNVKYRQNTIRISRLDPVSEKKQRGAQKQNPGNFPGFRGLTPRKFVTLGILRYLLKWYYTRVKFRFIDLFLKQHKKLTCPALEFKSSIRESR